MFDSFKKKLSDFDQYRKNVNDFNRYQKNIVEFNDYSDNKKYLDQLTEYLNNKVLLPSLHIVKQNNIHYYRKQYNLESLVETGTYLGDMVEAQKEYFKNIYSVELSEELHNAAKKRFKDDLNVEIVLGDSAIVLQEILVKLNTPALFWLDGHYSSGITAKGDKNTPILEELSLVLTHNSSHVILIDDARLFNGQEDYPNMIELCKFIDSTSPSKKAVVVADDIIRITNA